MGRLQRELRQNRPFQSPAQEAVLGLLRTADLMRRMITALVEPHGLTMQQFNVLRILRGADAEGRDGVPTLDIADRMIERTPGVTRLLDRLEAKDLVRRQRCPKDRRQHLCWITPKGLAILQKMDEVSARANEDLMKGLRPKERETLIRLMEAVRAPHQ
jgi:DNA-binding MarR family transcriptional regulator